MYMSQCDYGATFLACTSSATMFANGFSAAIYAITSSTLVFANR